jgi:hypothetical protein
MPNNVSIYILYVIIIYLAREIFKYFNQNKRHP